MTSAGSTQWEGEFFQRDRSVHPPALTPEYKTSVLRSPRQPLLSLQNSLSEVTGPLFGPGELGPLDNDLILNYAQGGQAIGERIIVHGQVRDERGRPVPNILLEFWQANAGGRYRHRNDRYIAPIDPNFGGCGRAISNQDGEYWFRTIKPGPYPFRNHINSWRPAHIHFSVFGTGFVQRLITQMYFEGDPLLARDVMFQMIPDREAARRLVAPIDFNATVPLDTLAYRFDIVLRGRRSTLFENKLQGSDGMARALDYLGETPSQTAGPYVHIGLIPHQAGFDVFANKFGNVLVGPGTQGERIIIEGRVLDGAGAPLKDALVEIWQANAAGRYNHPADRQEKSLDQAFRGWGRAGTDFETGLYRFATIKPGAVVGRSGHRAMAPHVNFWIVARGINIGLNTRMYFSDEEAANAADPVLNIIEPDIRRRTLIGRREVRNSAVIYSFDIYLQGDRETVFLDV